MYDPKYKVHWPPCVLGVCFGLLGAIFGDTLRTPLQLTRRVEEGLSRSFTGWGRKPLVPSTCAGDLRKV